MRDSFTIYRNTLEVFEQWPAETVKKAISYIGRYAIDGKEPDGEDMFAYGLFLQVKPVIDKSNTRAEAGRTGGMNKQTEANPKQTEANVKQIEANVKQTEANQSIKKKEENRKEKEENNKNTMSGKPAAEYPYKAVISYLNEKTGKNFQDKSKDTRKLIKARIDDGFTESDFYKVIDNTVKRWKGDAKMSDYLRPSTLFGTKFESYLNMIDSAEKPKPVVKQVNFPQRKYDMRELEKALLNGSYREGQA